MHGVLHRCSTGCVCASQAIVQHGLDIDAFLERAEFRGPRELQELADNGVDPPHLAVDQRQFGHHRIGPRAQGLADHIDIALEIVGAVQNHRMLGRGGQ